MVSGWLRKNSLGKILRRWRRENTAWRNFWDSYDQYADLCKPSSPPPIEHLFPCIYDKTDTTQIEPTYFYQDAWAFEHIVKRRSSFHVDIGSHHKYVALLSKVVPVTMVDIRPLSLPLDSLNFREGSILNLPYDSGSVPSVSSLCVIEHIGLGRYGDPLDPDGTEKALEELKRIVAPGGDLYISVPIDDENRTYFNAHRAFAEEYLVERFKPFTVMEKRYIYGNDYVKSRRNGFGVACYWLKSPHALKSS